MHTLTARRESENAHRSDLTRPKRPLRQAFFGTDATILLWLLVALGMAAAVRGIVLDSGGAPATIDSGNWLAFGNALLGNNVRSSTIVYPPMVPILVVGAVRAFGAQTGVAVVGAIASVAPALAVFFTLRSSRVRWPAFFLAVVVATAGSTGEAAAWGGFPQLFGLAAMLLAVWSFDNWLITGTQRGAIGAGVAILIVGATSDIVFGALMVCLGIVTVLRVLFSGRLMAGWGRLIRTGPLVAACSIPMLPIYLNLGAAFRNSTQSSQPGTRLSFADIPGAVEFLYRDLPWPWRISIAVAILTPAFLIHHRTSRLWVAATSISVTVLLTTVVLREARFAYLLPIGCVLSLGLWATEISEAHPKPATRRMLAGAIVLFACAQTVTGLRAFREQRTYYRILTPGILSSIKWIDAHSPPSALVAIPSIRSAPAGWWVEGLGERRSLGATPLRWLEFEDEKRRARIANLIFSEEFPSAATLNLAREAHVDYLLVPLSSEIIDGLRFRQFVRAHRSLVVFRSGDVLVLRGQPAGQLPRASPRR